MPWNMRWTARPFDQWAFSPLDPTASWLSHLALAIYMFVVNFDALAQAIDIRIERRQVVVLCYMQDSNPGSLRHQIASKLNARWQTDWPIEDQAKNLNSTARPYDQRAFSPLDPTARWLSHLVLGIYMFVVVNFDALALANDIRIERREAVVLRWMQDSNPGYLRHQIASKLNARWQTDWAIGDQAKDSNATARPYDQRAFSPLDWHEHNIWDVYIPEKNWQLIDINSFKISGHIFTYFYQTLHIARSKVIASVYKGLFLTDNFGYKYLQS